MTKVIALKPFTLMPEMRSVADGESIELDASRAESLIVSGLAEAGSAATQPKTETKTGEVVVERAVVAPQRKRKGGA